MASAELRARLRGLYVITDHTLCERDGLTDSVSAALAGGARIVQYRDKSTERERRLAEAKALSKLCHDAGALFIVNDDVALAAAVRADGVHVGRDDAAVAKARELIGPEAIIGASCYASMEHARTAYTQGADYVAFGSMFRSPSKPQATVASLSVLSAAHELELPVCAIGGIRPEHVRELAEHGADMVAVISGVFAATDIRAAAARYVNAWSGQG